MKVSNVRLIEKELMGGRITLPYTFFELNSSEKIIYNSFRIEHKKIKGKVREMNSEERDSLEGKVNQIFKDLITPYLEKSGVKLGMGFGGYDKRDTFMATNPAYKLFEKDNFFDISCEVVYWFPTNNEELACTSYLKETSSSYDKIQERITGDLISLCLGNQKLDGINRPIIDIRGNGIYFASTDFAVKIMKAIKIALGRIGKENFEELMILHREYDGKEAGTTPRKVLREAYDNKLVSLAMQADLIKQKLEVVD